MIKTTHSPGTFFALYRYNHIFDLHIRILINETKTKLNSDTQIQLITQSASFHTRTHAHKHIQITSFDTNAGYCECTSHSNTQTKAKNKTCHCIKKSHHKCHTVQYLRLIFLVIFCDFRKIPDYCPSAESNECCLLRSLNSLLSR